MNCRPNCAACCIAPAIATPIPGMPNGKPAGVACLNLNLETLRCSIWGQPSYPQLCAQFRPLPDVCGDNREQALRLIGDLEQATRP